MGMEIENHEIDQEILIAQLSDLSKDPESSESLVMRGGLPFYLPPLDSQTSHRDTAAVPRETNYTCEKYILSQYAVSRVI
jgi:hypothetical protein